MKLWREISLDPNHPRVMESRREMIGKARNKELVYDRVDYLCQLVSGRSILDIGVVEHTAGAIESPQWLHGHLSRCAATCLGVDVLESEINELNARGYNVITADITRQPLPHKFEIIVGGEVLEHLDSPGIFMKSCAAMLDKGGRLAITVPNPWYANAIAKSVLRSRTFVDSADHVAWYDASTLLELGQRHGLALDRFTGIGASDPKSPSAKLFFALRPFLLSVGLNPLLFAKSIIYEFVRIDDRDGCEGTS